MTDVVMKKLLLNLVKKHLLPEMNFHQGDLVKSAYGEKVFEVSAMYLTEELKPVLLIRDSDNRLYTVDPIGYVKYGGSINI